MSENFFEIIGFILGTFLTLFSALWPFIILIIILKTLFKNKNKNTNLLNKVFEVQHFSNISSSYYYDMSIIKANSHGENYIFGIKNNSYFLSTDVDKLYELSSKNHIHNIILITNSQSLVQSNILKKVKNYNMEIWDTEKLNSLLSNSTSTLKTSDTSDDTCKIDKSSYDPIDNTPKSNSLLGGLFNKPDRL